MYVSRVNGEIYEVSDVPDLDRYKMHTIEVIIDRLVVRQPQPDPDSPEEEPQGTDLTRLSDSVETALRLGEGVLIVSDVTDRDNPRDRTYSEHFACVKCGTSLPEIEPRTFSFNSPHGACPTCTGLGTLQEFDPELILDDDRSLEDGAIRPWRRQNDKDGDGYYRQLLRAVCKQYAIPFRVPVGELSLKQRDIILYGPPRKQDKVRIEYRTGSGEVRYYETGYAGVIPNLQRRYQETSSEYIRGQAGRLYERSPVPDLSWYALTPGSAGGHGSRPQHSRCDPPCCRRIPGLDPRVTGRQHSYRTCRQRLHIQTVILARHCRMHIAQTVINTRSVH